MTLEIVELSQAIGHDLGIGEYPLSLTQIEIVGGHHGMPQTQALRGRRDVLVGGVPQVVSATMVMYKPQTLIWVAQQIAGRTNRDQDIRSLADIHQPNRQHLLEHPVPDRNKGNLDRVDLVTPLAYGVY